MNGYQTYCPACHGHTSKVYARGHGGLCKTCFTNGREDAHDLSRLEHRSYDDIAREGGYEDTMGVSPEALEPLPDYDDYYDDRDCDYPEDDGDGRYDDDPSPY